MPHDRFNRKLSKGDKVMLVCEVKEVFTSENDCNVNLTVIGNEPYLPSLTCNSRLTELVQKKMETPPNQICLYCRRKFVECECNG